MKWNIWRGKPRTGKTIGLQQVVDFIKEAKTDFVMMQEWYGSGFKDSYRELYLDAKKYPCYSAPRNEDKIDFIYYKGAMLELIEAGKIIKNFKGKGNTPGYPSDHLGLTSKFNIN